MRPNGEGESLISSRRRGVMSTLEQALKEAKPNKKGARAAKAKGGGEIYKCIADKSGVHALVYGHMLIALCTSWDQLNAMCPDLIKGNWEPYFDPYTP
jgi:hypothetical protein